MSSLTDFFVNFGFYFGTYYPYVLFVLGFGLVVYFIIGILNMRRTGKNKISSEYNLLLVQVPKENEKSPLAAEQMFASLHGILKTPSEIKAGQSQEYLSFEITSIEDAICFFVFVPKHLKDFVEGQMYAQYPDVEIKVHDDYTSAIQPNSEIHFATTDLVLTKEDVYPLKTFMNFEVDPLSGITAVLGKVAANQQVWTQILTRPVDDNWQQKGNRLVKAMEKGIDTKTSLFKQAATGAFKFGGEVVSSAFSPTTTTSKSTSKPTEEKVELAGPIEAGLKSIEEKVTKLGFETIIRILATGETSEEARAKVISMVSAFKQFNTTNLNGFMASKIAIDDAASLAKFHNRSYDRSGYILNIEEMASLFHLPHMSVETPNIVWAGSKKGEPPSNLPIQGVTSDQQVTYFGKTDFRGEEVLFGIKEDDRRRHMYVIGKTGTGKTTMLENMVITDIHAGKGVAVVDPHGDFIERVIQFIPESRIKDTVVFNPADYMYPVGFNLLENVDVNLKSVVTSGLIGIFQKIWAYSWGPRLEHILRNTIMALLEYPNSTLVGILKMLSDPRFRNEVVKNLKDPVIRDFWEQEFAGYNDKFRSEAVAPIQNKVGQFVSSPIIRNIIGQPKSTIDIDQIMNDGKILLINLSKGKIGEDNSALLGAMMITKIQLAAMSRANLPDEERKDFYLYVDEFQNFATESFGTIFSEARKYKLNIIVANQYITQMEETVREAIFGNVGSIISFRVGANDAPFLAKEFTPVFEENDLVNLDKYHIYSKMAIDGVTCPAFSATTLPPYTAEANYADQVIANSRQNYSRDLASVEEEIKRYGGFTTSDIMDQQAHQIKNDMSNIKQYSQPIQPAQSTPNIQNNPIQQHQPIIKRALSQPPISVNQNPINANDRDYNVAQKDNKVDLLPSVIIEKPASKTNNLPIEDQDNKINAGDRVFRSFLDAKSDPWYIEISLPKDKSENNSDQINQNVAKEKESDSNNNLDIKSHNLPAIKSDLPEKPKKEITRNIQSNQESSKDEEDFTSPKRSILKHFLNKPNHHQNLNEDKKSSDDDNKIITNNEIVDQNYIIQPLAGEEDASSVSQSEIMKEGEEIKI